jgi:ATP-binding cassette, subfamily B, bacterial
MLLRPHRRALGIYAGALCVATSIPLLAGIVLGRFVDAARRHAPFHELGMTAGAYAALGLVAALLSIVVGWRATDLSWRVTDVLRHRLADQVLSADLAFHRDNTRGELVSRADDDVTAMAQVLSQFVARVIAVIALGIGATVTLLALRPLLAGPYLAGITLVFALLWFQRRIAVPSAVEKRRALADVSGFLEERIAGADDIASLGAGAHSVSHLADRSGALIDSTYAATLINMRIVGSMKAALVAMEALMLGWGAFLLHRGSVSLGSVTMGWRFAAAMRSPIEQVVWRLAEVQDANGSAERVLTLLQQAESHPDRTGSCADAPLALHFEHVSLTYDDGDEPVLDDVTLHIGAGRSLGLVGRSGSGKTSIGRLALRLLTPSQGSITLGGTDLQRLVETDLRLRVTSIPQDVQLFPGTIRDNVTMFIPVPDARVHEALHAVGLDAWLTDQEGGLDASLLSRTSGAGLSAGEAQLLALARALVRDAHVIVLDEATSRIDPVTQERIAGATRRLLADRTAIVIAHRLETLSICDDIAVLDRGRVVEHGDRRSLAADPDSRFAGLLAAAQGKTMAGSGAGPCDDSSIDDLLGSEADDTVGAGPP